MSEVEPRPLRAVGAYLYAGGFAVGVRRAGFDVVAHLEGDNGYGVADARLNWPDLPIHYGPAKWPLGDLRNIDIDFAFANPPCAVWSPLGPVTTRGHEYWKEDPRLEHWFDSFRVLEEVSPRAWTLESVPQAYTRGRTVIDQLTKRALVRGYSVSHLFVNAKWMGIPQARKRFFIVAHKPAKLIGYSLNWAPAPTIGEVLAEVPEPGHHRSINDKFMTILRETKPGEGLSDVWMRLNPGYADNRNAQGKVVGRPSFQDQRLDPAAQSGAFVGDKYYHPTEDRMIGVEEMKAICGYPPGFRLAGSPSGWGSMLARAVMPPVGFWLARAVAQTLTLPDAAWADRRVTLIDVRKPGIPEVDLTPEYLDAAGRVRVRARADGAITWSWPNVSSKAPKTRAERVRILTGVSPRPNGPTHPSGVEANDETDHGNLPRVAAVGEDGDDGTAAVGSHPAEPASGAREGRTGRRYPAGETGGSADAGATSASDLKLQGGIYNPDRRYTVLTTVPADGGQSLGTGADGRSVVPTLALGNVSDNLSVHLELGESNPRPEAGEGSGRFIQRLWKTTVLTPEEILAAVHANFAGRTTARGDVYYNYKKLVDAGEAVRPWPGPSRAKTAASRLTADERNIVNEFERAAGATVESSRTPDSPYQGAATDSGFASGPEPTAAITPTTGCIAAAPALAAPAFPPRTIPYARLEAEPKRVAVIDWFPRTCGATDYGWHLAAAPGLELVSASASGRPLSAWNTPWEWKTLPYATAARTINEYDAVVLTDVACLAPELTERVGLPAYADVIANIEVPMTAVFHGGMAYKSTYDPVIDAIVRAPGFTGSIVAIREGQARERLARWGDQVRLVPNPFLPYRIDRVEGVIPQDKRRVVMMTARLASNKGQNALLAMLDDLEFDADVWGYNSFGFPSIAWRLYELGSALGYRADGEPALRKDKAALTHPNAPRFYTGAFAFTASNGRRYAYHDGYSKLSEIDWSPWLHLSMFSPDFHGLLEYTILDAIHAGSIVAVPAGTVDLAAYDGSIVELPCDGATVWANREGEVRPGRRPFDATATARTVNDLLRLPEEELEELRSRQSEAVRRRHAPAEAFRSVLAAFRGEGRRIDE